MCAGDICLSPKRQRPYSPKNEENKGTTTTTPNCGGCCIQNNNVGQCLNVATKQLPPKPLLEPLTPFQISSIPSLAMISLTIPTNYEKGIDGFLFNTKGDGGFLTTFECSHELDKNSLQALNHDDDEDQVHHVTNAFLTKQKQQKQELLKGKSISEPCAVCGDIASGIHFSVWTCNGCKTFFRRVVVENRTYSCNRSGNCPIDKDHRCSCRSCRFKKCLKVGMNSAELNIERRRKRKIAEISSPQFIVEKITDPLIKELMKRERQFTTLLTSTTTPIHPTIEDALKMPSSFQQFDFHKQNQMKTEDQMNFSYWRSKILSTTIEWAKSFDEFSKLKYEDRAALIVHSCFSILVFSEAFHTSERYTDRIVFPGGLSGFRNLSANIIKEKSGLIPTVVAVINQILVPIRRMKMTEIEYVLLCAIIFFDPGN
ncbi:unnamed protein product [Meloidogyne enterolobii]|uniref:Uncharacterized protein n=1 Tax=Meloidogyne enterolobii TaxID=390850 RepID=A0ACB0Z9U0_MELEN